MTTIHIPTVLPTPSRGYDLYWKFAAERQEIYFKRLQGMPPPWTEDPVLQSYRFTNCYRAADRVSQFLMRNVIYDAMRPFHEVFFRVLLFKLFNRIDTWHGLIATLGPISWHGYRRTEIVEAFELLAKEGAIYNPAYMIPPPPYGEKTDPKYLRHLLMLERMMARSVSSRVREAASLREVYFELAKTEGLGPFLAFQIAIDLNYSSYINHSEGSFVVAGPGAIDGISKCFPGCPKDKVEYVIQYVADKQEEEFARRGLRFRSLFGRALQLIDCQNLFCEISKYTRVAAPELVGAAGRTTIKQRYVSDSESPALIKPFFPLKWGLKVALP